MWAEECSQDAERKQIYDVRLIFANLSYSIPAVEASSRASREFWHATSRWFRITIIILTLWDPFLGCDNFEIIITVIFWRRLKSSALILVLHSVATLVLLITFFTFLWPSRLGSCSCHLHAWVVIVLPSINFFLLSSFKLCFAGENRLGRLLAVFLLLSTFFLSHSSK